MMETLYHLTLNSGHVSQTARSEVADSVIELLGPIIEAEGGWIPSMRGWYLDFMFPLEPSTRERMDGGAYFQIAREPDMSKRPIVGAIAAWSTAQSDIAWDLVKQGYEPLRGLLGPTAKPVPIKPPPLPWLAVWLTAHVLSVTDHVELAAFGDLERCVAWTLIGRTDDGP
jgi:hypothetical protein